MCLSITRRIAQFQPNLQTLGLGYIGGAAVSIALSCQWISLAGKTWDKSLLWFSA
jgi:hypothetical protein